MKRVVNNYPTTKVKMKARLNSALSQYREQGVVTEPLLNLVMHGVEAFLNDEKPWLVKQSTSIEQLKKRIKCVTIFEHYKGENKSSDLISLLAKHAHLSESSVNDYIYKELKLAEELVDVYEQNLNVQARLLQTRKLTLDEALGEFFGKV